MTKEILTEDKLEIMKDFLKKYSEENKPVKSLTNKEFVLALRSSIESMLKTGFSYDDISIALEKGGLKLKGATIREYLKDTKKTRTQKRKTDDKKVEKNSNKIESNTNENNTTERNAFERNRIGNRTSNEMVEDDFNS